jgi:transcriptional regulator with XRE-family HTH domain
MKTFSEMICQAIRASGESLNAIADATGVHHGQLSRFTRGERNITLDTAERICRHVGLELRPVKQAGKKPRTKGKQGRKT